ncbi:hypothetical protein C8J55DRAFT_424308, partial [Lentinula edodes]
SLRKSLSIAYAKPYAFAALFELLSDCLSFSQPQLLRRLLVYILLYEDEKFRPWNINVAKPDPLEGIMYVGLMRWS